MGRCIKFTSAMCLALIAVIATATDFKCNDTAVSLAGLPAELKTETSTLAFGDVRRLAAVEFSASFASANRLISPGLGNGASPGTRIDLSNFPNLRSIQMPLQVERVVDLESKTFAGGLDRNSTSPNFNIVKNSAFSNAACDTNAVDTWDKLDTAFTVLGTSSPAEGLAREYLADPVAFKRAYESKVVDALIPLIDAAANVLNKCFAPAETADYEKNHHVLQQMGRLVYGADAACTATLIGDARYAITARHCFKPLLTSPEKYAGDMWFIPYRSSNRYQVCAIGENEGLAQDKFASIDFDQVLVRLAATGQTVQPVRIAPVAELATTADEKAGNKDAPTLLQSVSYFPLARYALPQKFDSGYVVPQAGVCAAVSKTNTCFSHICSAVSGGSGSPIFASGAQRIVMVGTHTGGGAVNVTQDCQAPVGVQTNSAAIINTSRAPQFFAHSAQ